MVTPSKHFALPPRDKIPLESGSPHATDTVMLPGWSAQSRTGVATVPD